MADIVVKVALGRLNRNRRGNVEVSNVMRCEAINAPSTRLDLRLHRREVYSEPELRNRFPLWRESELAQHVRQPSRTDSTSPGRRLFSSAENYFNLLSYPVSRRPSWSHYIWALLFPPFSSVFGPVERERHP